MGRTVMPNSIIRYDLVSLTSRKGKRCAPEKCRDQYIQVKEAGTGCKAKYVIKGNAVVTFYFENTNVSRPKSRESSVRDACFGMAAASVSVKTSMEATPILRAIYNPNGEVVSYKMTFEALPKFLAVFKKRRRRQAMRLKGSISSLVRTSSLFSLVDVPVRNRKGSLGVNHPMQRLDTSGTYRETLDSVCI